MGDLHRASHRQQLVLAIEQTQLAAITGGKFPHREFRFAWSWHD
jgi:hypothetical protein